MPCRATSADRLECNWKCGRGLTTNGTGEALETDATGCETALSESALVRHPDPHDRLSYHLAGGNLCRGPDRARFTTSRLERFERRAGVGLPDRAPTFRRASAE